MFAVADVAIATVDKVLILDEAKLGYREVLDTRGLQALATGGADTNV
jgi:hypothetical protein